MTLRNDTEFTDNKYENGESNVLICEFKPKLHSECLYHSCKNGFFVTIKKYRVIQMQKRMALVYPTEQMRRLKLVPLSYGNIECYILFRGNPNRSMVNHLERVNIRGKGTDDRVGYLTSQWIMEESKENY